MCLTDRRAIAMLFNVTVSNYNISSCSTATKKNIIGSMLEDNPEGIIAVFHNSTYLSHAVVIKSTDYAYDSIDYSGFLDCYYTPNGDKITISQNRSDLINTSLINTSSLTTKYSLEEYNKGTYHEQDELLRNTTSNSFSDGDQFIVYDPGRKNGNYCGGVTLNETYSSVYYDWGDLVQIIEID